MYFFIGREPTTRRATRSAACVVVCWLSLLFADVIAEETSSAVLSLEEASQLALVAEPGIEAYGASAQAMRSAAAAATGLPSPTLRVGLNNYPIQSGDFSTEGMTNAGIVFRQAFPSGDTREFREAQLGWQATASERMSDARRRVVHREVHESWLERYYWNAARSLVTASRPFFEDLAATTLSLYSVGRKSQQDVLRADLELSRLDMRLIEIAQAEAAAKARLGRWLGEHADRPMPADLPVAARVPSLEELMSALGEHPDLLAADAALEASRSAVQLADEKSKPGWALDVGYSYRDGALPSGESRPDFFTIGVTMDLPFFQRTSLDSELSAALGQRSAAEARTEELHRELAARLRSEYSRYEELGRRLALFDEEILEQSTAHAQATLLAYQSDTADFADVMRAHIDDLNIRIDYIRLKTERLQSRAMLASLGGF